jgi:hypothetical protein
MSQRWHHWEWYNKDSERRQPPARARLTHRTFRGPETEKAPGAKFARRLLGLLDEDGGKASRFSSVERGHVYDVDTNSRRQRS